MRNQQKINTINCFLLILFLFLTSFSSLKTLKKVNFNNLTIYGSQLFSKEDLVNNSSLDFSTRLIFIKTKLIEKELKQNLSLDQVSLRRQIFPFGLKIFIKTRTPIAYGERILNGIKISGFIDEEGIFISKNHVEEKNLGDLYIQVFGWHENFRKTLSKILISQNNNDFELIKVNFSPNGFLTLEEKYLKTIFLGFNPDLLLTQLQKIRDLKNQLKKNNFSYEIDNVDLTDPNKPKIKVFKP